MDEVFRALADPSRRLLLDGLNARNGQTLRELCADLDMTRQAVSKHLAVLEAAGIVTTAWRGREKLHHLNAEPINAIADRWISRYHREKAGVLADLKRALEEPLSDTEFVYITHIKTTPERLWDALTNPAFTKKYWGVEFDTDWQVGSPMTWDHLGTVMSDPEQVVLEADKPHRLSYTWHTITPEFATSIGLDDAERDALAAEPRTKVTFTIEPTDDAVKLTVVHDGFEPGSELRNGVSEGWPALLSSLKSFLETGSPLSEPEPARS